MEDRVEKIFYQPCKLAGELKMRVTKVQKVMSVLDE